MMHISCRTAAIISQAEDAEWRTTGKGDNTIKELNQCTSIVIDPALAEDEHFWPYVLVVVDEGQCTVNALGPNGDSMRKLLGAHGVSEEDIDYYFILEEEATNEPTGSSCALVARSDSVATLSKEAVASFAKVITVGAEERSSDRDDEEASVDGLIDGADIAVLGLSELRALTICSYAALTKGC